MTSRNRAIVEVAETEKRFIFPDAQEYYYQGVFKLVDYTYENDKDEKILEKNLYLDYAR